MTMRKNTYRVLIAGANDKIFDSLRELLPKDTYETPLRASSGGEAKRMLLDTSVDLVILNAPLRDEFDSISQKFSVFIVYHVVLHLILNHPRRGFLHCQLFIVTCQLK